MRQEYDQEKRVGTIFFEYGEKLLTDQEIITAFLLIDPTVENIWIWVGGELKDRGKLARDRIGQGQWWRCYPAPPPIKVIFEKARLAVVS
jgi:hypothetical protein